MFTKRMIIGLAAALLLPIAAIAQTSPDDPAVQEAKEKTAVVFDLGRLFGYLNTMERDSPSLALSRTQLESIYEIMDTIAATKRIEPDEAERLLTQIEDEILKPDQLMEADQLAIAKMNSRETGTNTPGSGGGQITSHIAGGAFNPMLDTTKTIGMDFSTFYEYVKRKVGK